MCLRHVALIVEDEPEMAAELADLLDSFGHDHRHAATKAEAIELLEEGGLCYVLLDLQILARAESIRPRVEAGMSLLREIRRRHPARTADGGGHDIHLLPVLAVSGRPQAARARRPRPRPKDQALPVAQRAFRPCGLRCGDRDGGRRHGPGRDRAAVPALAGLWGGDAEWRGISVHRLPPARRRPPASRGGAAGRALAVREGRARRGGLR